MLAKIVLTVFHMSHLSIIRTLIIGGFLHGLFHANIAIVKKVQQLMV